MEHSLVSIPDYKRRRIDQGNEGGFGSCSDQDWGGMISWVPCRPSPPGLHVFELAASSGACV